MRLDHEVRAKLARFGLETLIGEAGHDDGRHGPRRHRQQLKAVVASQPDVDDHEIGVLFLQQTSRFFQRAGAEGPVSGIREQHE